MRGENAMVVEVENGVTMRVMNGTKLSSAVASANVEETGVEDDYPTLQKTRTAKRNARARLTEKSMKGQEKEEEQNVSALT